MYAKVAAYVRACAVKLGVMRNGNLNCTLPNVAAFSESQIVDIISTGTCTQLNQFRCGHTFEMYLDSKIRESVWSLDSQTYYFQYLKYLMVRQFIAWPITVQTLSWWKGFYFGLRALLPFHSRAENCLKLGNMNLSAPTRLSCCMWL